MENVVHLSLVLLNGGRNTRIPDFPSHKATATALSLVSPDLAVNSSLSTKNDPFGNGHLPVVNILNEKPDNLSPTEGQNQNIIVIEQIGNNFKTHYYHMTFIV